MSAEAATRNRPPPDIVHLKLTQRPLPLVLWHDPHARPHPHPQRRRGPRGGRRGAVPPRAQRGRGRRERGRAVCAGRGGGGLDLFWRPHAGPVARRGGGGGEGGVNV